MSSEPITDSPDPRLQAALAEFLERIDRGEPVDREAFLAEYPDLATELAPLLETADALEQIGGNTSEPRTLDVSTHSQLSHDIETIAPGRKGQEADTSGPLPADFGRYRVIKPLGQGAMGVVYLAEDTQLHRKVALKTSSFDDDQSGELLERFYREARSAATLRHPNICPVYDVGEIQGRHYISMAYIEGRTLATYVNTSGSLHERQVLVLVRKLALALQDAHQHEIVHRDLKPANIMVDLKGEPIIMDFGLARVGYSEEESRLTQVGMIVGSPAYMSPEQVGGRPEQLTGAADQYSLGVILFELLVKHPPFRGPVTAVVGQILTQPPPRLSSLRSDVSPAVEALCLKMLAKSPSDRFASMKQVAEEIATLLRGSSTEKGPTGQEDRATPATSIPKTSLHAALVDEARQRLKQRDYPKAIEMLQQIPEAERPAEAAKLLAQALKLMDEVNFVLQEMEAALQSRDGATLARRAQELVKLKPDHPRARQVRELIKKHGPERALQFLAEDSGTTPPVDRGSQRRIGLIAGGVLAALLLGFVIWFGSGKTLLKVTVNDPTIEVTFRGSQLSIKDGASQVDVEPGEQELTIRVAGVEFQTPKFILKKGTTSVVEVERAENTLAVNLAGTELAAWPLEKAATAPPATATQSVTPTADPNGAIDLLAAVDVSQLGDSDMKWERKGQTVVCTGTGAAGKSAWKGFRLPTEIGGDYEVELEFQQRAFWPMQIDFPMQDTVLRVSLTGDYCDLMIEDDKTQPNAEKTWRSRAATLKTMVPQKLVVRVRQPGTRAEIEATLDGVTLGTYSGERRRLVLPSWVNPNFKQITSGSLCGNLAEGYIELRKAVYRPLSRVSPESVGVSPSADSSPPMSSSHASAKSGTTVSDTDDGWGDLFNGRDLTGWEVVNNKGVYPNSTDAGWAVVDGAIECQTTDHGWLRTADEFEDFDLELKFRFAGQGSSSLILRTRGPVAPLADGLWVDLNHSAAGGVALARIDSQSRLLPAGEWNQMRIEARGTRYRVEVNGHITAETDLSAHHWAASLKQAGRIGLNNYKGQAKGVAFRDIRIRKQPQAPATLPAEAADGWADLFNGRDLSGWTAMGFQGWRIENGVLIGETATESGWLRSPTEYDNFEFDFEYRLSPGAASGVFLRAPRFGDLSGKDFHEVQLMDETAEEFRSIELNRRTGSLFGQITPKPLTALEPNVWQRMTIAVSGDQLSVKVNADQVTRGTLPAGKPDRGFLGLQIHRQKSHAPQRCEFRNIRVRQLKDGLPVAQAAEKMPQDNAVVEPNDDTAPAQADRGSQEVQHGLKAEIFEGRNFEKKVGEQIEPNVECFWELGAPSKDAPVDNFSVRFTGWLRAPKTGLYKLFLSSKDGSRLKINHQTLIDNWKLKPEVAEVSLELTQDPQPIEVEVYNADLYSWVSLLWQPAGTATACHIPATALFPDLENARSKAPGSSIEKTGLVAEYFDKTLSRRLAIDHVYRIEEIWGPHSPRWGLPRDSGAKYTGILVPPVSGQYKLIASAREHIRVWIDEKPTLEARGMQPGQNAVVNLEANKPYEIRVEILTTNHGAHYLHWILPGTTKEVSIPPECLFPNKAAVRQVTNVPPIKAPTEEKPAPSTISAAERETIERGLAKLKADDEAAGKKLLKAFDEQIEKARSAPKIPADERVVRIKSLEEEKALFEKHGQIPFSLAVRTETLKYLREFTEARTDAAKVYDKLIESLTKQKKDELASLMRTERDIAVGPKVLATWQTTEVNGGKKADWSIWSDGSVGKPDRQFLWMMDERRFVIQWRKDPPWVDAFDIQPDSLKANVYNDRGIHVIRAVRAAP